MEEELDDHIVSSQNVLEFVTVVSEYCIFVENTLRYSQKDFLDKTRKILSLLYLKASLLPKLETNFDDENEKFVTEEEWDIINKSVQLKLGGYNDYSDVLDSMNIGKNEIFIASISDNLADIYQDLKNFVNLYNIGTEEIMNDALWECQKNFEEFWGQKLVSALKAIHGVYFGADDLEDETRSDNIEEPDTRDWLLTKRQADYRKKE